MERCGKPVKVSIKGKDWYYQVFYTDGGKVEAVRIYNAGGDFLRELKSLNRAMVWLNKFAEKQKEKEVSEAKRNSGKYDEEMNENKREDWITKEEKSENQRVVMERLGFLVDKYGGIRELAEEVGLHPYTVSNYVVGARFPTAHAVKRIATRCGVTIDWIMGKE